MCKTPACFMGEVEVHFKKMIKCRHYSRISLKLGFASLQVLLRKHNGTVRWCTDYRVLNKVTVKDVFLLLLVDVCLNTLAGNHWFSQFNANSAYWQINIKHEDRHKVHSQYGQYDHIKMKFGLFNVPRMYAHVVNLVTCYLNWKTLLTF